MFRKIQLIAYFAISSFFLFTNVILAESIKDFLVNIQINADATIDVEETILYDAELAEKHGIIRDIKALSAQGEDLIITNINVSADDEQDYPFSEIVSGDKLRLKIGRSNSTFNGEKKYKITYSVKNAIGYFDTFDELYWNVTGNEWQFPIKKVRAKINLPIGASLVQQASYCGPTGSKNSCQLSGENSFSFDQVLEAGDGMSVALGFNKGAVHEPTRTEKLLENIKDWWVIPLSFLIALFWHRKKIAVAITNRRYYKNNPIIAEYDANGFNPLESSIFVDKYYTDKSLVAIIVSLAISGYIKIENQDGEFFFKKNKEIDTNLKDEEKYILELISDRSESTIKSLISSKSDIDDALSFVTNRLIARDYVSRFDQSVNINNKSSALQNIVISLFLAVNPGIFIFFFFNSFLGWNLIPSFLFSFVSIFIGILFLFFRKSPVDLTAKGLEAERYLLGLKKYITVAEKDRIAFQNAPVKSPVLFEKLLPYAILFDLEAKWSKEFEGILNYKPNWTSGADLTSVISGLSNSSLISISSLSYYTPRSSSGFSSSSSGSSGGGSSGGGGGGGGGSSW